MQPLMRTSAVRRLSKALAVALVLAACSGGGVVNSGTTTSSSTTATSSSGGRVCVPGAQVSCACPGGKQGVQLCKPDGSGLEACQGCASGSGGGGGTSTSSSTGTGGSTSCGNTATDPKNCGACGHACPSGTCTASLCQPVTLASDGGLPRGIVVDATNVYFTGGILGAVTKVPIAGGSPVALTTTNGSAESAIAVDATNVYYVAVGGTLMKVPLDGATAATALAPVIVYQSQQSLGMGVDATSVYVLGANGGNGPASAVLKVPIDGGAVTPLGTDNLGIGMVMNATSIFWMYTYTGQILTVPTSGGATTTLVSAAEPPGQFTGTGIAMDATSVYWVDAGAGAVMKVPIGGGTPTVLASGGAMADGMAVDATNVYWTDAGTMSVRKVPVGGGAMTTVATGYYPPFGIALDATNVYWTVPRASTVLMVPK